MHGSPARALDPSSHLAPASPRVGLGKEGGERSGAKRARRGSEARSRARNGGARYASLARILAGLRQWGRRAPGSELRAVHAWLRCARLPAFLQPNLR